MPAPAGALAGAPPSSDLLRGLTGAQRHAVGLDAARLCVVAAAGSGKTTVLTRRVARRVREGSARPEHVLVVTFTRKAAGELRHRLARLGVPGPVGAGTFHAVALAQLRSHWADRGVRPPVLVDDPRRLLGAVLQGDGADGATVAALAGEVHWAQVRMLGPGDYPDAARAAGRAVPPGWTLPEVGAVLARYGAEKRRRGVMDLDDLVTRCATVLEDDATAGAAVRWRVRHLFVDEFQDVNPAQWRLLRAWMGPDPDLFVVGDPEQAIYSWNGADPTFLDRLPELVPGTEVVRLDDNHRSTPQVLSAASAALGASRVRASRPDGPAPLVAGFDDEEEEAAAVARWLRRMHRPGQPWAHQAVLARTHARLEPLVRALERAQVPHRVAGTAGAQRTVLAELRRLPRHRPVRSALADLVTAGTGGGGAVSASPAAAAGRDLARLVDDCVLDVPDATVGEFLAWWAAGGEDRGPLAPHDGVELCTFHRAKGLEWRSVAVVGLEEGMVPIAYATTEAAVAEERRLLYVALSRAEDDLWCSWARQRRAGDRTWSCQPSGLLPAL
ncbi:MAG TPA: ATP-dependent helicase, partial [Acidimicrobiales bacterium]|nr:ATP-dependent helicase [Acidimicrobiales bacterium]